ncbi:hypothetical protein LZ32DRAFT_446307 [Colletotrichum eremochloae]|nr:hypothetical protein LZ32DRAFT_446307 [Colletotrichum eremochloae]
MAAWVSVSSLANFQVRCTLRTGTVIDGGRERMDRLQHHAAVTGVARNYAIQFSRTREPAHTPTHTHTHPPTHTHTHTHTHDRYGQWPWLVARKLRPWPWPWSRPQRIQRAQMPGIRTV